MCIVEIHMKKYKMNKRSYYIVIVQALEYRKTI